jgi:hypothetical protein
LSRECFDQINSILWERSRRTTAHHQKADDIFPPPSERCHQSREKTGAQALISLVASSRKSATWTGSGWARACATFGSSRPMRCCVSASINSRLLLQRFAQLVEQPSILNGDHGLIGEGLGQLNLFVGEW